MLDIKIIQEVRVMSEINERCFTVGSLLVG